MTRRVVIFTLLSLLFIGGGIEAATASSPRLVVNIIVSSLRSGDIERYIDNMGEGGFKTLTQEGLYYRRSEYNFARSSSPATLASLSSGADPSMHGVVGEAWFNYSSNQRESLIEDSRYRNIPKNYDKAGYSPSMLLSQTLSEALIEQSPKSRSLTVALTPMEAIVTGGDSGNLFWIEPSTSQWASSTAFMDRLPDWVDSFNSKSQPIFNRAFSSWQVSSTTKSYLNHRYSDIDISRHRERKSMQRDESSKKSLVDLINSYNRIKYTPLGNTLIFEFAKAAMANLEMGRDEHLDIVNIHLTSTGVISGVYGRESVEVEDMLYRLDDELEEFINYTKAQLKGGEVIFTLTSDSGGSSSYDSKETGANQTKLFNPIQAEVILNGFLSARHGDGKWVLGCWDGSIYLNHNTIYQYGQSAADIQNEVATFMMHFEGVAYALTASSLQSSAFNYGYGELIQRSFFARRSGDVILSLLPGWIEREDNIRSKSGSIYRYDREVPLIIYGHGIEPQRVNERVNIGSFASTLSLIMDIDSPTSNQGEPLKEVTNKIWNR